MSNKQTPEQAAIEALNDRLSRVTAHLSEHPKVSYAALCGRAARAGIPQEKVVAALEAAIEQSMANARDTIATAYEVAAGEAKQERTKFQAPTLASVSLD